MPRKPLDQAIYDLTEAFRFPQYTTREAYAKATGKQPPPFDYSRRVKYWEDPTALTLGLQEGENITYVTAYSITGKPFFAADGKTPRLGSVSLSPEQAASVNIPDPGTTTPLGGLNATEVPMPIVLLDEEALTFGKTPMDSATIKIRRLNWPDTPTTGGTSDPTVLKDIQSTLQAMQRDIKAIKSNLGVA